MKRQLTFIFWCFFLFSLQGQQEKLSVVDTLQEAHVAEPKIFVEQPGLKTHTLNPNLSPFGDFATLLAEQSPVFVRSFGPSGLATTSFRGGHASHTSVLWNGMPINSGLNGQFDLSLLPVQVADEVQVQSGGGAALWGSGAVGGSVLLQSRPHFDNGHQGILSLIGGSFGQMGITGGAKFSGKKYAADIQISERRAVNDFPYRNPLLADAPLTRMPEMNLRQSLFTGNFHQKTGRYGLLSTAVWLQKFNRQLQPIILQPKATARQIDQSVRISNNWSGQRGSFEWLTRTGIFVEDLVYLDSLSDLNSQQQLVTFIQHLQVGYQMVGFKLLAGANYENRKIETGQFDGHPTQEQVAFLLAPTWLIPNDKGQVRLNLRKEYFDNGWLPFIYSLGADYQIFKSLNLRGHLGRVYRVPTLNDRFWLPGGNPGLLPESGFAMETGMDIHIRKNAFEWSVSSTIFSRRMENWIMWQPGNFYWEPRNLLEVWSRGAESFGKLTWHLGKHRFWAQITTNYVLSTNERAHFVGDQSVGKQLIYVPIYNGNAIVGFETNKLGVRWIQQYIGYRYTTTDHSHFLPPGHLSGLQIDYNANFFKVPIKSFLRLNNLFSSDVFLVAHRPLPLMFIEGGLTLAFQFLTSNKSS
jgi:vitamin B12 transporter